MDLGERFQKIDDEEQDADFEDIYQDDKLNPNRKLCGFLKLASLLHDPKNFPLSAEHDIIYLANENDLKTLSDDDILYLCRCGIHWDSDIECFYTFT